MKFLKRFETPKDFAHAIEFWAAVLMPGELAMRTSLTANAATGQGRGKNIVLTKTAREAALEAFVSIRQDIKR